MVFWSNETLGTIQYVYNCTSTEVTIVGGARPWMEILLLILATLCLITMITLFTKRLITSEKQGKL